MYPFLILDPGDTKDAKKSWKLNSGERFQKSTFRLRLEENGFEMCLQFRFQLALISWKLKTAVQNSEFRRGETAAESGMARRYTHLTDAAMHDCSEKYWTEQHHYNSPHNGNGNSCQALSQAKRTPEYCSNHHLCCCSLHQLQLSTFYLTSCSTM